MKNFNFGIKNFRAFDANGVNLEVAPITILTGCNSSGKSSFVKAIGLLDSFLQQIKVDLEKDRDIQLDKYVLNFKSNQNKLLGNFNSVLNDKNLTEITFSYNIYSLILSCDVNVELTFSAEENIQDEENNIKKDKSNNGYLKQLVISTDKGVIYSSSTKKAPICNLNLYKDAFIEFIIYYLGINKYLGKASEQNVYGTVSRDELNNLLSIYNQLYNDIKYQNTLKFIRNNTYFKTDIINGEDVKADDLEKIFNKYDQNKSLFQIGVVEKFWNVTAKNMATKANMLLKKLKPSQTFNEKIINKIKIAIDLIIDDFSKSNAKTFGEYYLSKEFSFLDNVLHRRQFPLFMTEKHPSINPGISIKEDNLGTNRLETDSKVSFELIYETFMEIETNSFFDKTFSMIRKYDEFARHSHKLYNILSKSFKYFLLECVTPNWCNAIQYANSGNIPQRRFYNLDEENALISTLNKYFKSYRESKRTNFKDYIPDSFANKWIQRFGIADKINIEQDSEGFGIIKITLEKYGNIMHLADHGLGITYLVYCILQIEAAILAAKGENVNRFIGLSDLDKYTEQKFHFEDQIVAIEEPESHLHPNYQSRLAEMFVEAYQKYNIRFVIETHSEYLIRKLQTLVADSNNKYHINSDKILIHYFNRPDKLLDKISHEQQVKLIKIKANGYLTDKFGKGFFDESDTHINKIFELNLK